MSAEAAVATLRAAGLTVAAAESLTGGQVCVALSEAAGSSSVFVGGVVTYTVETKVRLLGVDAELLARHGPVAPEVAQQMASAAKRRTGADVAVATTGVAGPQPHGGHPPGFAYIGWAVADRQGAVEVRLSGDRATVRSGVTQLALGVVEQCARVGGVVAEELPRWANAVNRE